VKKGLLFCTDTSGNLTTKFKIKEEEEEGE
jgi:hypothetical protein